MRLVVWENSGFSSGDKYITFTVVQTCAVLGFYVA
jgi:hypothetical protein